MESNSLDDVKLEMLNAFEEYVIQIFKNYEDNQIDENSFKKHMILFFESWNFARIDIKNVNNNTNNFKILNNEPFYHISFPIWLNDDDGKGFVVQSIKDIHLELECIGNGKIHIKLMSKDFRDLNNKRIPIYINFVKFAINDSVIFKNSCLTSVDEFNKFTHLCQDTDIIALDFEFKTIYDYFPNLKNICYMLNEDSVNIYDFYSSLNDYIVFSKNVIQNKCRETYLSEYNNLSKRINLLLDNFNEFKEYNNKILDSYNVLFDTLFKFYNLQPKSLVKYSRELSIQLLDLIDNICKKHDFQWWLVGGSLLGSIRHEGFIPWDDDLDIGMLRDDYEKFLRIINKELQFYNLDKHIKFRTDSGNNSYHFIKMEYRVKGRLFSFIDIFPFDFILEPSKDLKKIYEIEYWDFHKKLIGGRDRLEVLKESFKKLNASPKKTNFLMTGIERNYFRVYNYDYIFPLKRNRFEERCYPCPNNSKECLKIFFGDGIMNVPKIVEQHGFYDMLFSFDDALEILKKHSLLIKKINDSYQSNYLE